MQKEKDQPPKHVLSSFFPLQKIQLTMNKFIPKEN
jgi:hypothetical protein